MIEDLVQGILESTRYTLRDADRALSELKAAYHAAHVLAGEASRVLDGMMCWSRQDCTEFRKELNWELQAFSKANTELELYPMLWKEKQTAHLRASFASFCHGTSCETSHRESLAGPQLRMGGAPETQAGSSSAHPPRGELGAGWPARSAGRLCR
jgi:hypothetical protein